MSKSSSFTVVTFVGGPLHGLQQRLDAPPAKFWRDLPNGSALLYECRWTSAAAGVGRIGPEHAVYSPVGMSQHAYRELLPTVELEWHEEVLGSLHYEDAKRSSNSGNTP